MTALYIISGIAVLIAVIMLLRVKLYVKLDTASQSSGVISYITVLFFKYGLTPSKREKIKLSDFSAEKFKRYIAYDKAEKEKLKQLRKSQAGKKHTGILDSLEEIKYILERLLFGTSKKLRCRVCDFDIKVGTGDVMTTSLLYPLVVTSADNILNFIDSSIDFRVNDVKNINITPDYSSNKVNAKINIVFSMTVFGIVTTLGDLIVRYLKHMIEKDNYKNSKSERNR